MSHSLWRWGSPCLRSHPAKDNAVLLHGTTGSLQLLQPSMADRLFGAGKPLDCAMYFLTRDWSRQLKQARHHGGTNFPQYGYKDIVNAQHSVVRDVIWPP